MIPRSVAALGMAGALVHTVAAVNVLPASVSYNDAAPAAPDSTGGIRPTSNPLFLRAPDATCGYVEGDKSKHVSGQRRADGHPITQCLDYG